MSHGFADEHLVRTGVERHVAQLIRHTVGAHHLPCDGGGALDIAGGAGGDVAQHHLLGGAAAQQRHDLLGHIRLGAVGTILLRQEDGHAAGLSAGHDGDLMHRVVVGQRVDDHGVTRLVIGRQLPLDLRDHAAALLRPGDDLDDRLVDHILGDELLIPPSRQQRRLVQQVLQIGAGKARGAAGHLSQLHILRQRLALGVDLQDLLPALDVGQAHIHLPVEPSRTQQGGVEDIHTVGGGQHHNALVDGEAVHLHQQLVQRLLPLVVAAAQTAAALASHRVDLIDKHDGRRLLLGLLKQVADAAGAHAHIHLHKIGAGDGQIRHIRLPRHGLGQQRLAGTRRADQQHALGNVRAQRRVLLRIPQELDDLLQLLLLLIGARHILERDLLAARGQALGPRLAEARHLIVGRPAAGGHPAHQVQQQDKAQHPQHIGQQHLHPVGGVVGVVVVCLNDTCLVLLHHQVVQVVVKRLKAVQLTGGGGAVPQAGRQPLAVDNEGLHLLRCEHGAHLAVRDIAGAPHIAGQIPHKNHHEDHQQQSRDAKSSSLQSFSPLCDPPDALPALLRADGDRQQHTAL